MIDFALQLEGQQPIVETEHESGNGPRPQVTAAAHSGGIGFDLVPVDVNRLDAGQADMYAAVDRRSGGRQYAADRKRLVAVIGCQAIGAEAMS